MDSEDNSTALTILQREIDAHSQPTWRRYIFKMIKVLLYAASLLSIIFFVLAISSPDNSEGSGGLVPVPAPDATATVAATVLVILLAVLLMLILILTLLNLPYLWRLNQNHRLAKTLGLLDTLTSRFQGAMSSIGDIILLMQPLLLLALILLFAFNRKIIWLPFFAIFMIITLLILLLARRSERRLAYLSALQDSLKTPATAESSAEDAIGFLDDTYQKVARIERAQISRRRLQAIRAAKDELQSPYGIIVTKAARPVLSRLPATVRLSIQDAFDELSLNPTIGRDADAVDDDLKCLTVADAPVSIFYSVDESTRRVEVIRIEHRDDAASESDIKG